MTTRRKFLQQCSASAAAMWLIPTAGAPPQLAFPAQPHDRIAVASYPFRDFIVASAKASNNTPPQAKIELKYFAAHVVERFGINKIEPWSGHFPSLEAKYLEQFRKELEASHAQVVNVAVDGTLSPYSEKGSERGQAIEFSKRWIDAAISIGSPGIRTHIPEAQDSKPNLARAADSLAQVADYAQSRDIVVHLENDDPVSEDPLFLAALIDKVDSPWLRALPDFANTLAGGDEDYAYKSIDQLFARAYGICHVKEWETGANNRPVHVDMTKTFGIAKQHMYRGYCSMEWDSPGDPYSGTTALIEKTMQYLSGGS
jgi:sugar phosphate isomerase/epimerase